MSELPPQPDPLSLERAALERVSGPAGALRITAALGAAWSVLQALVAIGGLFIAASEREVRDDEAVVGALGVGLVMCVSLGVALVIWIGAGRMRRLQGLGLAFVGACLAVLPCVSPCCWIGLPCGLWALFVLLDEDVRRAFR